MTEFEKYLRNCYNYDICEKLFNWLGEDLYNDLVFDSNFNVEQSNCDVNEIIQIILESKFDTYLCDNFPLISNMNLFYLTYDFSEITKYNEKECLNEIDGYYENWKYSKEYLDKIEEEKKTFYKSVCQFVKNFQQDLKDFNIL